MVPLLLWQNESTTSIWTAPPTRGLIELSPADLDHTIAAVVFSSMKSRHSRNGGRERHNRLAVMAVSLSVVMALMSLCVLDYSGGIGECDLPCFLRCDVNIGLRGLLAGRGVV